MKLEDELRKTVRLEALTDAWNSINQWIKPGPLEADYQRELRNGMVLASNQIMDLIWREHL